MPGQEAVISAVFRAPYIFIFLVPAEEIEFPQSLADSLLCIQNVY